MGVPGTVPRSVRAAAILSYVSAGLAFTGGVAISFALQLPQPVGLITGIIWFSMAASIRIRRPWMDASAAALFALGTMMTPIEPLIEVVYQAVGVTPYLIVFEVVQWLPALAAFLLLWTRGTTGYYRQLRNREQQQMKQQMKQQMEQQRAELVNRHRIQDRRKRARRASVRSRRLSRR